MNQSATQKFGVRFLTRKERTVRRVTKLETREIKKRLAPPAPIRIKVVKPRAVPARPKPATLIKIQQPKKAKPTDEILIIENEKEIEEVRPILTGRILQSNDLQKLSRLSCAREFSFFHKEIKSVLRTNEHKLAFFQTKLFHLKNEFINQMSQQANLQQIRDYFAQAFQKNIQRKIKPDEFVILADKLKHDIKQAIDKWLKRKDFGKQQRPLSEYSQKRQIRIRELIKETMQQNTSQLYEKDFQDQSLNEELSIID